MNFAAINGISINYKYLNKGADKQLIVFSNSLGTDFRIWQSCFENLIQDYSVLLYDKWEHGLSGLSTTPYVINDHINDLIALMDYLRISKVVLVGL